MQFMQRTLRYADDAYCALYHLAYYFSRGPADDQDRKRLLAFKDSDEAAQRYFILNTLEALKKQEPPEDLIILRALGSKETSVDDNSSPLDRPGDSIAMVYGCSYYPKIVTKARVTKPLKMLNLRERKDELIDVYQVDPHFFNFNYHPVMVIDDIVTTGATTGSIIGSIIRSFPRAKVSVLSMAWTPSPAQQEFLQREQFNNNKISEEECPYGWKTSYWEDSDFIHAKTDISVFSI